MAVTAELQTAGRLSLVHIFALPPLVVLHVLHIILLLERAQMPVQAHVKIIALCVYVYQDNRSVCLCISRQLLCVSMYVTTIVLIVYI
jgi:quinol-cytochrome oxidoreductase complex cytochrome b subunit